MKKIPDTFRGSSSGHKQRINPVIDVILHGGAISDIVDIPKGITIRVWDYDVQGEQTDDLHRSPYDERWARLEYWE